MAGTVSMAGMVRTAGKVSMAGMAGAVRMASMVSAVRADRTLMHWFPVPPCVRSSAG